jgi:putative transposase
MAADNPIWARNVSPTSELKLGIRVSPRTVGKYLRDGTVRAPDPKQRWLTFVDNHAKAIAACGFFVVVTATCGYRKLRPDLKMWVFSLQD